MQRHRLRPLKGRPRRSLSDFRVMPYDSQDDLRKGTWILAYGTAHRVLIVEGDRIWVADRWIWKQEIRARLIPLKRD